MFRGVGNGTLTGLTATSIAAQQFVVTLEDLGTVTRAAWAPFHAATLQALTTGTAGSTYTLTVDQSGADGDGDGLQRAARAERGRRHLRAPPTISGGPVLEPDGSVPDSRRRGCGSAMMWPSTGTGRVSRGRISLPI